MHAHNLPVLNEAAAAQVSLDQIQLLDFVHTAISIQRSDAVAVVGLQIKAEVSLDQVRGVVVDGSKRVFVGQTDITTSGSSISAVTTTSELLF